MDKKLRELKTTFENETPVTFTDRDKQKVLENINHKSSRKINHFFPHTITAFMIIALLFVGIFVANDQFNFISFSVPGADDNDGVRSKVILENVISEDGEEYRFEQIPWFSTKQELIDNGHIPPNFDKNVTIQPDGESIMLNNNIMFKDPQSEAKVIYKFQHDLFIGGEYIIIAESDDDLVRIATDLKNKVNEYFPEPVEGTLDGLAEDTIRAIRHGDSQGASWWKGNNNIDYSSFEIRIMKNGNGEGIIQLSVRPPKLSEELEKELIEKGYLSPNEEESTQDDDRINEITYETTIELANELLEVYTQYAASIDDLLLENLKPIDIFKLYHHAHQAENWEVVYALFIQGEMYDIPNKETFLNDLTSTENEGMRENARKSYEALKIVKEFKEMYTDDDEAIITYSTDSSEYDHFFRLIKDNHTDIWKVSWLPIQ